MIRNLAAEIEQSRARVFVIESPNKRLVQFSDYMLRATLGSK